MLKIYTDSNFLDEKYRRNIFPLLLDLYFLKSESLLKYYTLVKSISESDIIIVPLEYQHAINYPKELQTLYDVAEKNNKPIWIYTGGDYGYTINKPNLFNFRLSGFKSKLNKNTFILSSFIEDPYDKKIKKDFFILKKTKQPSIGFVGHAKGGFVKYLKEFLIYIKNNIKRIFLGLKADYQPFYPSSIKRASYLKILIDNVNVSDDFLLRNQYRAGVKTHADRERTTQEFYQNIIDNLYTFCVRGAGNFSVRFYETLALGRIPVLLDTDCLLPLNENIDWTKHCVIIDQIKGDEVAQQLVSFHKNKTEDELMKMQENNRLLWKNKLTRDSFFKTIHQIFKEKITLKDEI